MKLEIFTAVLESLFWGYTIIITPIITGKNEKLFDKFAEISLVGSQYSTASEDGHNMNFNKEIIAFVERRRRIHFEQYSMTEFASINNSQGYNWNPGACDTELMTSCMMAPGQVSHGTTLLKHIESTLMFCVSAFAALSIIHSTVRFPVKHTVLFSEPHWSLTMYLNQSRHY